MNFTFVEPGTIFLDDTQLDSLASHRYARPVAGYCSRSEDSFILMIDWKLEQTVLAWFLDYKQIVDYEIIERKKLLYNIKFTIKVSNIKE